MAEEPKATQVYQCWNLYEADKLDSDEVQLGYRDGRRGEPQPDYPGNRSLAYHHGWWAGSRDGGTVTREQAPWLNELARQYLAKQPGKLRKKHG